MEEGVEAAETNPFAFADEILGYSNRLWKTLAYFSALGSSSELAWGRAYSISSASKYGRSVRYAI